MLPRNDGLGTRAEGSIRPGNKHFAHVFIIKTNDNTIDEVEVLLTLKSSHQEKPREAISCIHRPFIDQITSVVENFAHTTEQHFLEVNARATTDTRNDINKELYARRQVGYLVVLMYRRKPTVCKGVVNRRLVHGHFGVYSLVDPLNCFGRNLAELWRGVLIAIDYPMFPYAIHAHVISAAEVWEVKTFDKLTHVKGRR